MILLLVLRWDSVQTLTLIANFLFFSYIQYKIHENDEAAEITGGKTI